MEKLVSFLFGIFVIRWGGGGAMQTDVNGMNSPWFFPINYSNAKMAMVEWEQTRKADYKSYKSQIKVIWLLF